MSAYRFTIGALQSDNQSWARLCLPTTDGRHELRVRLCPTDAQLLATTLAGLATPAGRMARLVQRLAERLDAQPQAVLLQRKSDNVIEAALVLGVGMETVEVSLTFGDAILLARVNQLPIHGDASLAPLVKSTPSAEPDEDVELPAVFSAFLDTLGAE
ncbi:MAG TPA: bifunctional nuclease domain-containing protein [Roseiflexaceae bacterium]|nr:bifunctional nuclease domain-containing protein [Roseiflexaceae bacterium]